MQLSKAETLVQRGSTIRTSFLHEDLAERRRWVGRCCILRVGRGAFVMGWFLLTMGGGWVLRRALIEEDKGKGYV